MMSCRFFVDHCVPNAIMQTRREGGHEVVRLREQLPIESPDAMVIAKAQQLDAILLVFEWGLYGYCAYKPADYQGIILYAAELQTLSLGSTGLAHLPARAHFRRLPPAPEWLCREDEPLRISRAVVSMWTGTPAILAREEGVSRPRACHADIKASVCP